MNAAFDLFLCAMILGSAACAVLVRDALTAVVVFVVLGGLLSLAWLRLGAVDVALAELGIGAGVTGLILVLAKARLRRAGDAVSADGPAWPMLALAALSCAGFAGALGYAVWSIAPADALGARVADALPGLGIENPVTGVLLVFRGYDTLLETFVLLGAVVAVWSLTREGESQRRPPSLRVPDPSMHAVVRAVARLLLPAGTLIAAYLVWAGSDEPGGAFQGGAVLAGVLLVGALGGVAQAPLAASVGSRAVLLAGPLTFLAVAVVGAASSGFLTYPEGLEKLVIVGIEYALAVSIGATLALLAMGPLRVRRPTLAE